MIGLMALMINYIEGTFIYFNIIYNTRVLLQFLLKVQYNMVGRVNFLLAFVYRHYSIMTHENLYEAPLDNSKNRSSSFALKLQTTLQKYISIKVSQSFNFANFSTIMIDCVCL